MVLNTGYLTRWVSIYRITSVLKVETDIIASIALIRRGQVVILVIMNVKIFKTGIIVFIGDTDR
jgi:hypothetical protein